MRHTIRKLSISEYPLISGPHDLTYYRYPDRHPRRNPLKEQGAAGRQATAPAALGKSAESPLQIEDSPSNFVYREVNF